MKHQIYLIKLKMKKIKGKSIIIIIKKKKIQNKKKQKKKDQELPKKN